MLSVCLVCLVVCVRACCKQCQCFVVGSEEIFLLMLHRALTKYHDNVQYRSYTPISDMDAEGYFDLMVKVRDGPAPPAAAVSLSCANCPAHAFQIDAFRF